MRINKASLAVALALGGLLVGSTLAYAQANDSGEKKQGKRGMPTVEEQMTRIDDAVKLTDDEKPKVKAALEDNRKAMTEAFSAPQEERRDKMQAARTDLDTKMKGILTPDQYEKYKAMPRPGRGGKKDGGDKKDEKKE